MPAEQRGRRALRRLALPAALLAAALLPGCREVEQLRDRFRDETPREAYARSLEEAGLASSALARDWVKAAELALAEAAPLPLPFEESGYFPPEEPSAVGYRVHARRGQALVVEAALEPDTAALLFLELYHLPDDSAARPRRVASAESGVGAVEYEPRRDGTYLLLLQPELLRGGRYTLRARAAPTLSFPVAGRDERAIASGFGAARDGGRREHHGVDIFAPRGTPVLAAAEGVATRVHETPRGGKVVWLRDRARAQSLYYAHLDTQLVASGARVRAGDTLGLVGNTGNARGTPPHLHFGIYSGGEGPVDPRPFVERPRTEPPPLEADTSVLGDWVRAARAEVRLRAGPTTDAAVVAELPRNAAMRVRGATGRWFRVRLPDGGGGFVAAALVEPASSPILVAEEADAVAVLDRPAQPAALMVSVPAPTELPVLGRWGEFRLVRAPDGRLGWAVL